mmetsp:Transcript_133754/g.346268  ORF Transcript_133754/g.346268 Transcript_133754/m.346268 type:complete len:150 (-) Transcript_133754:18-467(-)
MAAMCCAALVCATDWGRRRLPRTVVATNMLLSLNIKGALSLSSLAPTLRTPSTSNTRIVSTAFPSPSVCPGTLLCTRGFGVVRNAETGNRGVLDGGGGAGAAGESDEEFSDGETRNKPRVKFPAQRPRQVKGVFKGSGVPNRRKHRWKH